LVVSGEGKILEFPAVARPKLVRTSAEAARVPLHLPVQVELALMPADRMHDAMVRVRQAKKQTIRAIETELALVNQRAEQLKLELYCRYRA
jgi:hypothetical protein